MDYNAHRSLAWKQHSRLELTVVDLFTDINLINVKLIAHIITTVSVDQVRRQSA